MKKIVLAAAVLALGTVSASAADLAARPYTKAPPMVAAVYDWSGFYIGANGGWGTSHNCWTNTAVGGVPFAPAPEGCHDADGGTVGGQIGYRWQAGNWVFGLEAQGNWADFTVQNASLLPAPPSTARTIDAFGLFTGQVGYATSRQDQSTRRYQRLTASDYKPKRRRTVKDLPAPVATLNAVACVFMYTTLGLGDREIADTLNITTKQLKDVRGHPAYAECFDAITAEFININSDLINARIAAYSHDALTEIANIALNGKEEKNRLREVRT